MPNLPESAVGYRRDLVEAGHSNIEAAFPKPLALADLTGVSFHYLYLEWI